MTHASRGLPVYCATWEGGTGICGLRHLGGSFQGAPQRGSEGASEPRVEGTFSKIGIPVIPDMLLKLKDIGKCHRGLVLQGGRGRAQGFSGHDIPGEPIGEFPAGLRGNSRTPSSRSKSFKRRMPVMPEVLVEELDSRKYIETYETLPARVPHSSDPLECLARVASRMRPSTVLQQGGAVFPVPWVVASGDPTVRSSRNC